MNRASRNGAVELLRFLFAVCIALYHAAAFFGTTLEFGSFKLFCNGAVGVEFFLILSGFLMARSAYKKSASEAPCNLGSETLSFTAKKYFSVFRYSAVFFFAAFIIEVIGKKLTISDSASLLLDGLPQLFILDMTGLKFTLTNGYTWYLSAMIIAMIITYPFMRKWPSFFSKIAAPLTAVLLYGIIVANYGTIATIGTWTGLAYKGLLRALGGIMLGCGSFALYKAISKIDFTLFGKIILSLIEIAIYICSFVYICLPMSDSYYFYLAFMFALAIPLTFSGFGLGGLIKGNAFWGFCGKCSLTIYLCQWSVHNAIQYFTDLRNETALIVFAAATIIVSVIATLLIDLLAKIPFKKLFVK